MTSHSWVFVFSAGDTSVFAIEIIEFAMWMAREKLLLAWAMNYLAAVAMLEIVVLLDTSYPNLCRRLSVRYDRA